MKMTLTFTKKFNDDDLAREIVLAKKRDAQRIMDFIEALCVTFVAGDELHMMLKSYTKNW